MTPCVLCLYLVYHFISLHIPSIRLLTFEFEKNEEFPIGKRRNYEICKFFMAVSSFMTHFQLSLDFQLWHGRLHNTCKFLWAYSWGQNWNNVRFVFIGHNFKVESLKIVNWFDHSSLKLALNLVFFQFFLYELLGLVEPRFFATINIDF
jgi:hypothetical protein